MVEAVGVTGDETVEQQGTRRLGSAETFDGGDGLDR